MGSVHVMYKFPEAVIEGSRPNTVSLLKHEIAHCGLIIQQIKVDLNRLSSAKSKEQLNKYNRCVEQLDTRLKYRLKYRNLKNSNHYYSKGEIFCYLLALLDFCLGLGMHWKVHT